MRQRQCKTRCGKAKSTARPDQNTPDQTNQTRPEIDEPMKNYRLPGKSFPKQTLPREDTLSRFQNRYLREKTRGRQSKTNDQQNFRSLKRNHEAQESQNSKSAQNQKYHRSLPKSVEVLAPFCARQIQSSQSLKIIKLNPFPAFVSRRIFPTNPNSIKSMLSVGLDEKPIPQNNPDRKQRFSATVQIS